MRISQLKNVKNLRKNSVWRTNTNEWVESLIDWQAYTYSYYYFLSVFAALTLNSTIIYKQLDQVNKYRTVNFNTSACKNTLHFNTCKLNTFDSIMIFLKLIKVTIEGHIQVYTFQTNSSTTVIKTQQKEIGTKILFVIFFEIFVKTFETNMDTHELERLKCYLKDMWIIMDYHEIKLQGKKWFGLHFKCFESNIESWLVVNEVVFESPIQKPVTTAFDTVRQNQFHWWKVAENRELPEDQARRELSWWATKAVFPLWGNCYQ